MRAAEVRAALGASVTVSRKEQETLRTLGAQARDMISEQNEQLTAQLREKKHELVD